MEKYLITLVGFASFKILIPIACAPGFFALWKKDRFIRNVSLKLIAFAIIIYTIIPASVTISDLIYQTYEVSIQETVDTAEKTAALAETEDGEESGVIDKIIDLVKNTASTITSFATDILSNFIEALAIMIVTSCLIPVAVLMAFVWLSRLLFSIPIEDHNILRIPDDLLHKLEE